MNRLLQRIRGLLGLAGVGAVGGGLLGAIWSAVESVVLAPGVQVLLVVNVATWALVGATTALGFGLLLTSTTGHRRLEDVSPWRARLLGAVAGGVGALFLLLAQAASAPLPLILVVGGAMAVLGSSLGSVLIGVAQSADTDDAVAAAGDPELLESGPGASGSTS